MSEETLIGYGLVPVATVRIVDNRFTIDLHDREMGERERCIYAFLVGGEIVRIGSSKGRLRTRFRDWERDVSGALAGSDKRTSIEEGEGWRRVLTEHGSGTIYARPGSVVTTPVGEFCTYLDEESILIGRHRPILNSSKHR